MLLEQRFKRVTATALVVAAIIASALIGFFGSTTEEATASTNKTGTISTSGTPYYYGSWSTNRYTATFTDSDGETISDKLAMCVYPSKQAPTGSNISVTVTEMSDWNNAANVVYYGLSSYSGDDCFFESQYTSLSAENRWVITHIAASYAYFGESQSSWNKALYGLSGSEYTWYKTRAKALYNYADDNTLPSGTMYFKDMNTGKKFKFSSGNYTLKPGNGGTYVTDSGRLRTHTLKYKVDGTSSTCAMTFTVPQYCEVVIKSSDNSKYSAGDIITASHDVTLYNGDTFFIRSRSDSDDHDMEYYAENLAGETQRVEGSNSSTPYRLYGSGVKDMTAYRLTTESDEQPLIAINGETTYTKLTLVWPETENSTVNLEIYKVSTDEDATENNSCYSLEGAVFTATNTTTGNVYTLTTDEDGYAVQEDIDYGTYTIEETKTPDNWETAETFTKSITEKTIEDSEEDNVYVYEINVDETPIYGSISIKKVPTLAALAASNNLYQDLTATYGVYAKKAFGKYSKNDLVTTIVTNDEGEGSVDGIPLGSYYVEEISAAANYKITGDVTEDSEYFIVDFLTLTDEGTTTASIEATEYLEYSSGLDLTIYKVDAETGESSPQGGATLEGAVFKIDYYDTQDYDDVDTLTANETADATWYIESKEETDDDGNTVYLAHLSEDYLADGYDSDDFYYDSEEESDTDREVIIPVGTITIEEVEAPTGYNLTDYVIYAADDDGSYDDSSESSSSVFMTRIYDTSTSVDDDNGVYFEFGNVYSVADKVKRRDIYFKKVDDDNQPMAYVPFQIDSLDADGNVIETHIVYTDENGYYHSGETLHSLNTNAWDDGWTDEEVGTWFGVNQNGTVAEIDDDAGAFPYGQYVLTELDDDVNYGYRLTDDRTFSIKRDQVYDSKIAELDLGTIINYHITLNTVAKDDETDTHYGYATENAVINDTITYGGLESGTEYELTTKLVDVETGEVLTDEDGNEASFTNTVTASSLSGTWEISVTWDMSDHAGDTIVIYEYIQEVDGRLYFEHTDITDTDQMIYYPEIGTTAEDGENGTNEVNADEDITLVDTVSYSNLKAGKEYTVTGTLYDQETGEAVTDDDGNAITATTTFTAEDTEGTVDVTFTFSGVNLAGKTLVVFETLTYNNKKLAVHADIDDEGQTVYCPVLSTVAIDSDTAAHVSYADESVIITDTVSYANVQVGNTYTITGYLVKRSDSTSLTTDYQVEIVEDAEAEDDTEDEDETEVTTEATDGVYYVSETFTAEDTSGTVDLTFSINASELAGEELVLFEDLYNADGYIVANHEDLTDEDQTIYLPNIGTTAFYTESGIKSVAPGTDVSVTDTVAYESLTPGLTYTVTGTIVDKATGEYITDSNGNVVTASTEFTPEEQDGTVDVTFTLDTTVLEGGTELVVYETAYYGDYIIATHEDIDDEDQTLYIPEIGTTLTDNATGTHSSYPDGEVVLTDVVSYTGLTPGLEYTVTGVLMDQATGKELLDANNQKITATTTFTPKNSSGTVELTFTFDATGLENTTTVAYETVYYTDCVIAEHKDLDDEDQSVYFPKIKTKAVNADPSSEGKNVLRRESTETVVDTVTYKNLVPGTEYTVSGYLMDKETNTKVLDADGNIVTGSTTFTPKSANGTVEVEFTFDTTEYVGDDLVVFESLYTGKKVNDKKIVAVHEDIDDSSQTVTVSTTLLDDDNPDYDESEYTVDEDEPTGDNAGMFAGIAIVCVIAGCVIVGLSVRRKRKLA